jgi:mRNA-degrading endonuclease RelE of RelBE toxin-antitoxin system
MYEVVWTSEAEQELTRLWLEARDRQYVRETTFTFDERVSQFPLLVGESRDGDLRVAFEGTFFFTYEVNQTKRIVTVRSISRLKRGL